MKLDRVILFDGVCNLCNGAVQYVIRHDPKANFNFASLQSNIGQQLLQSNGLSQQQFDSFVLIENNIAYTKSTAALRVAKKLKGPVKILYGFIIIPRFLRDWLYEFIAANRYRWFGKKESCMIPGPDLKQRFLND
ncbi:MAG TPA: thiol-disulfide oxidoreductase DCC family protein [Ferruginibacter sp.]|nr:thiol-disulfide oxidoreductase DCC family protein [Ferruginibacter sp.]